MATYWGRRINSSFVEKSAKNYMMKYLSKTDLMCANYRSFGSSTNRAERIDKTSVVFQINANHYIDVGESQKALNAFHYS